MLFGVFVCGNNLSLRQISPLEKCPFGKTSFGKMSFGKMSAAEDLPGYCDVGEASLHHGNQLCYVRQFRNRICNRTWLASFCVSQTSHALFPNFGINNCFTNLTGSIWRKQSTKLKNGWWKMDLSIIPSRHLKISPISY